MYIQRMVENLRGITWESEQAARNRLQVWQDATREIVSDDNIRRYINDLGLRFLRGQDLSE